MSVFLRLKTPEARQLGGTSNLDGSRPVELKRCLGFWDCFTFGVASVVGAGIFVSVGVAGKEAGPGLVLAFALSGVACLPTALCYSELSTRFPFAGSSYTFASRTLGDYFAFIVGFSLMVDGAVTCAAVAKACASYTAQFLLCFNIRLPAFFISLQVNDAINISLLAPVFLVIVGLIAYRGVDVMAKCNNILTAVNLLLILGVIVAGIPFIEVENFDPFLANGMPGVERAAALTFFAMIGFDASTSLAEETVEPEKTLPRAILCTVVFTTLLYMIVSFVYCGMVGESEVDMTAPLADAFRTRSQPVLATIIAVGAMGNTSSTLLGAVTRLPRFVLRMSTDGHLPAAFGVLDRSTEAPTRALAITMVVATALSALVSFSALIQMASVGGLVGFSMVNAAVLMVRCRQVPDSFVATMQEPKANDEIVPTPIGVQDSGDVPHASESSSSQVASTVASDSDESITNTAEQLWVNPTMNEIILVILILTFFIAALQLWLSLIRGDHWSGSMAAGIVLGIAGLLIVVRFSLIRRPVQAVEQHVFWTPFVPWLPLAALLCNTFIIANLPIMALLRFLILESFLGSCIYFARLRARQVLRSSGRKKRRNGHAYNNFGKQSPAEMNGA
mmetsp:Transcript_73913/g.161771  ORF Transcript_73913/g.161771 Transcript_73913/m.161771 type:complete len:619 (-) Transcript_73913:581-2437(-)